MPEPLSCWHLAWGRAHAACLPGTSPYAAWTVQPAPSVDALRTSLGASAVDREPVVLVTAADDAEARRLLDEHGGQLLTMASRAAFIVVVGSADADAAASRAAPLAPETAIALTQAGALAVLDGSMAGDASAPAVARTLRLALERHRVLRDLRTTWANDLATGLPTEASLREHLAHLIALREREPATMALLLVDVADLDAAIPHAGSEAANVLRRKLAVRIRAGLRSSDVVASAEGNRFWVLLSWLDDPADAQTVAEKIRLALTRPVQVAGHAAVLRARVAQARYPADATNVDALLRTARAALDGAAWVGSQGGAPIGSAGRSAANDG